MSNNYMTEQYMTSILQQYQQNSPQKTSQSESQNFNQFVENEEQIRRQLNESLFKSIDDSFERQMSEMSVDKTRMTDTPIRVQQMVRDPVITSDSFKKPVNQSNSRQKFQYMRKGGPIGAQMSRTEYYGQSMPQTRGRGQTYKAKVIDYYNGIIVKPKAPTNLMSQNLRPVSVTSVLTERNIDPMSSPIRVAQSVSALHSAISSISQKPVPQRPVIPKPILRNSSQNMTNKLKPVFNRLANNTSLNSSQKVVSQPKSGPSLQEEATPERDTLVDGYENEGIIRTFDLDKSEAFYCYYCNTYMKKVSKLEKHCEINFHKNNMRQTLENSLNNPLNKRFIFGQISLNERLGSIGLSAETVFRMELDRILLQNKHFYYVRGIRLKNPGGPDAYYCCFCQQSIQTLANIESHLSTESHRKNNSQTSISKLLSQTTEPIIGLQYITEYMSADLPQAMYECCLCKCFEEAYPMYLHVCSFKHRLNLLKKLNPNEVILNTIKESPQAVKEIKKRIAYLSETVSTGAIIKVRNSPNLKKLQEYQRMKCDIEVIDITDDDVQGSPQLKKRLAIRVSNEEEAADASTVIHALKESVVKYYLSKIPAHMRRVLINEVMDEKIMDLT